MHLKLYVNESAPNVVDKTISQITDLDSFHFKESTDNYNIDVIINYNSNYDKCNYIEIPHLNKYYYVDSIEYGSQRIILHCHVDVLMSFKTKIKSSKQIIINQENKGDMYLADAEWKEDSRQYVRNIYFNEDHFNHGQDSYLLAVIS